MIYCFPSWNSTYKIIERILEQEKAIFKVLGSDKKFVHLILKEEMIALMKSVIAGLGKAAVLTDLLSRKTIQV